MAKAVKKTVRKKRRERGEMEGDKTYPLLLNIP